MQNPKIETFQDLVVWQKAHGLLQQIYQKTVKFPKKELTGIVPQIREAAIQIPINIALGFKKRSKKAKVHYYRSALDSIEEIRYLIILADDLGFYKDALDTLEEFEIIEKMLKRLIRSNISPRD
jgi:four helix bundle protein